MTIEIKAPQFPESVADGTVATWHKLPGEPVSRDELIVDIETDKVVLEVVAPEDGSIKEIFKNEDDTVLSEEVMAIFEAGAIASASSDSASGDSASSDSAPEAVASNSAAGDADAQVSPAARNILAEKGLTAADVKGTGRNGLITKEDAVKAQKPAAQTSAPAATAAPVVEAVGDRVEKRVPMTRLRKMVAKRLVDAQQTAAMLTTFNEVDMKPVMDLRKQYKDLFEKKHDGSKLGFMSFFVKAATEALKRFPVVNASIDGDDIVYHGFQDIGIAVSSERGLVVPVLRNAESMGMAEIESTIRDYGQRAQKGALGLDEMQGGTFTITNGGVFGSLISTPILNPPQSAILGMHAIKERPVAVNGQVEIRPMMYLALSYDHRLLDGKEAVQFLVAIKDMLEDPARILLEV